ncbi:MAG: DUF58 domain-containing protein [Microbacteriaceae bacterium]|nr:DUF58 domain-containing protein [Microbacteriaceae bacterium]
MALSGWFVILMALGAVPLVATGQWYWILVWPAFAVLLGMIDFALAASARTLRVTRYTPGRVRLGETVEFELTLENLGRKFLRGKLRDSWQPSAVVQPTRVSIRVPAGERRKYRLTLTPIRRGERRTSEIVIRSVGPLRLVARQTVLDVPGRIRVLPPFNSRKHLPSRLAMLRELEGRTPVMIRGQGTEFDSLREYVRGDDRRSIDWRATARRFDPQGGNKLMVRTWRPERDRQVVILIDSGRSSATRIENEPRLDTYFESALLLAALATHAGDRVNLLVFDRRVRGRVQGFSGAELLSKMVDAMAPIEPELLEPDWAAVPGLIRSITSHRTLVVIATSIETASASTGLLGILGQLTKRHTVVVASVTDPTILETTSQRQDREEVYRAAAAERALLDLSRLSAAIHQVGAEVVTDSPYKLPPALADRYIALKAAGRL